jgi:subtilisin family serine protease
VNGVAASVHDVSDASAVAALTLAGLPPLMNIASGTGVTVGLIDGPVRLDHRDLEANNIHVLSARGATCQTPDSFACSHGTLVAGLLHARRDSLAPGICPGCRLLVRPIFPEAREVSRSTDMPSATPEDVTRAIYEVLDAGARIINLSVALLGQGSRSEQQLEHALHAAAHRGVIVVVAAGNDGLVGSSSITRHPWVIPVVGCERTGRILSTSNLGASIGSRGLSAPGQDILGLSSRGGYERFSGTSVAVAFVVGAIALLSAAVPRATPTALRLAVTRGSGHTRRSVTPPLLDAWRAYQTLAYPSPNAGVAQ